MPLKWFAPLIPTIDWNCPAIYKGADSIAVEQNTCHSAAFLVRIQEKTQSIHQVEIFCAHKCAQVHKQRSISVAPTRFQTKNGSPNNPSLCIQFHFNTPACPRSLETQMLFDSCPFCHFPEKQGQKKKQHPSWHVIVFSIKAPDRKVACGCQRCCPDPQKSIRLLESVTLQIKQVHNIMGREKSSTNWKGGLS